MIFLKSYKNYLGNKRKWYYGFRTKQVYKFDGWKWGNSILIIFYPFNEGAQLVGTGQENVDESKVYEIVPAIPFLNIYTDASLWSTGEGMRKQWQPLFSLPGLRISSGIICSKIFHSLWSIFDQEIDQFRGKSELLADHYPKKQETFLSYFLVPLFSKQC